MSQDLFITGTDTNVGKTVLCALLVAALEATYWKPIQTGAAEGTDRHAVMRWAEVPEERTVAECYCFDPPVSPHLAAESCGATIELGRISRPPLPPGVGLVIEGAGGVLVPINGSDLMLDVIRKLDAPVVVASRTALGTINHTLLTLRALRDAAVRVKGVVMIGRENRDNERAIERFGAVPVIGRIPLLGNICRGALLEVFQKHFDGNSFA